MLFIELGPQNESTNWDHELSPQIESTNRVQELSSRTKSTNWVLGVQLTFSRGSSGSATEDWSDTMPSSLSWKCESCSKASASVRLATTTCCWDTVEVGVARLLPPTPFVGGLDWCWPPGVQDEPSDDAPEVEDKGEDDPSWIEGDEAELGTVVDDKSEEVVDKSEMKIMNWKNEFCLMVNTT